MTSAADDAAALVAQAREHRNGGRYDECSRLLQQVLRRDPFNGPAMLEGALLASATGDHAVAEQFALACRQFDPGNADLLEILSGAAFHQRAPERSVAYLRQGALLAPDRLSIRIALAQLLLAAGDVAGGERELRAAFAIPAPDGSEPGERRALARVTAGAWDEGWREFARHWEARFAPHFRAPRWWRGEALAGRPLYAVAYGGLGDTIFFARFLPRAARLAGRLRLCVPPATERLLSSLDGVEGFEPGVEAIPAGSTICSLWHLPWVTSGASDDRYAPSPYLTAPTDAPQLPERPGLRVGVVWSGNRRMGHDADRSPPGIETFAPLFAVPGVAWQGLQVEEASKSEGLAYGVAPLPPVRDLADTAGILRQLDLVVTVDSVVANLAPALGIPTWVFPTTVPEPRWPMGHDRSPWFPHVRPFRRRHLREWEPAVRAAAEALAEHVARAADAGLSGDRRRPTP